MPVAQGGPGGGEIEQLIASASILQLERAVAADGRDPSSIWRTPAQWADFGAPLDAWIDRAASGLAQASLAALSIIDFEAIVIDGAMPSRRARTALPRASSRSFTRWIGAGFRRPSSLRAPSAPTRGRSAGAALPLIKSFARDREVLFKDAPAGPS